MNLFELFVKIGVDDQASDKISSLSSNLGSGLKTAAKVGAAAITAVTAATAAMTTALMNGVSQTAEYGDNIDKMSQKMGMTAEAYQEWDAVMQHCGTSIDSMQAGMKTLATAAESGSDAFEQLGISQEDIANMSQEELFGATITALQNVESETERTYLAGQLLGRGATELGALLNTSAEDTQAMKDRVHELGGVMSDEAVKAAVAYQDSLQDMKTAFSGLSRGLTSNFMPAITTIMDGLTEIFSGEGDSGIALINQGINDFVDNMASVIPEILDTGTQIVTSLLGAITDNLPSLIDAGIGMVMQLLTGIAESLPELATSAISILEQLVTSISDNLPMLLEAALETVMVLANGIAESLPELEPVVIDVMLQIVNTLTNPDTLSNLVDAALVIILALSNGLIDAIPRLLESIPVIIGNLVQAIIDSVPQLIFAAGELVFGLIDGLTSPDNTEALLNGTIEMLGSIIIGIASYYKQMFEKGGEIFTNIKEGFMQFINDPIQWGKDLIDNFISGITQKWENLKNTVANVAQSVKDFLGFSEPKKGPLSNFHTYAPDMMDLFIKGIRDNEKKLTDQIEKTFDFGDRTITAGISYSSYWDGGFSSGSGYGSSQVSVVQNIYSEAKTAADLMQEALYQQERAVLLGV